MIAAFEIYFSIGLAIWIALDACGIISDTDAERIAAGKPMGLAIVSSTVALVVMWPLFVWIWLRGMLS